MKMDAVDDVRRRVPVGEVLRILRAVGDAVPEFDRAAGADQRMAHAHRGSTAVASVIAAIDRDRRSSCRWRRGHGVSRLFLDLRAVDQRQLGQGEEKVSGMMPKTLKLTQMSVEKFRQTISLSTASTRKKRPQRKVSFRQPSSVELEDANRRRSRAATCRRAGRRAARRRTAR